MNTETETPSNFHPQWMLQYRFWKASDWQHLQNNAVRAHMDKKHTQWNNG